MSKLGKLVLILLLVTIVSFSFAGITLVRNEQFMEHLHRNYNIESSGELIDWLRALGSDYDMTKPGKLFIVDDQIDFGIGGNIEDIDIDSIAASIIVISWDEEMARAELEGEVSYNGDVKPFLMVDSSGETLAIKVMYGESGNMNFLQNDLELRVYLPRRLSSDVDLMSVSGNVQISQSDIGELKIATVSGNVVVDAVQATEIDIESVSGVVSVNVESIDEDITIKTVSGNIEISIAKSTDLYLDFSAISGQGNFDYPFDESIKLDDNELELRRGSGEYDVRVRSTSGDLNFKLME